MKKTEFGKIRKQIEDDSKQITKQNADQQEFLPKTQTRRANGLATLVDVVEQFPLQQPGVCECDEEDRTGQVAAVQLLGKEGRAAEAFPRRKGKTKRRKSADDFPILEVVPKGARLLDVDGRSLDGLTEAQENKSAAEGQAVQTQLLRRNRVCSKEKNELIFST